MRPVVHTHEPSLSRPAEFVAAAWRDLCRSRPLALELAKRDIRSQYRHSLSGPLATIVFPLTLTVLALGFHESGILNAASAEIPYPLYVLIGVVLWTTFVELLNAPVYGLLSELRLLSRTTAPPEAILLGKLGPVLLNFVLKTALIALALLWYRMPLHVSSMLAVVGVLGLALLGIAVGLLIAPLNLLYRDISWLLGTATTVWFFFSPVYFPIAASGTLARIMNLNPVTPLLFDTRSLLLTGHAAMPLRSLAIIGASAVVLFGAWIYARLALNIAIEQVND